MLYHHGYSYETISLSSSNIIDRKSSTVIVMKILLIISLLSNHIPQYSAQAYKPKKSDEGLPNMIRVIKRSYSENEYPGEELHDNAAVNLPSTKDQETYHYAPWWWSENIQPYKKRGNVQMAYRMIKRTPPRNDALGYSRDYAHNHSQHQEPDYPGVSPNIDRKYKQREGKPVGLRKYSSYWKRANQWEKRKKEANIFRLIKRSDTK